MGLTAEQWAAFDRDGFVKLGRTLSDDELAALQQRCDDLMDGTVQHDNLLMQATLCL